MASGPGVGRHAEARMLAARKMGWTTLLVNAILGNTDMTRIYAYRLARRVASKARLDRTWGRA